MRLVLLSCSVNISRVTLSVQRGSRTRRAVSARVNQETRERVIANEYKIFLFPSDGLSSFSHSKRWCRLRQTRKFHPSLLIFRLFFFFLVVHNCAARDRNFPEKLGEIWSSPRKMRWRRRDNHRRTNYIFLLFFGDIYTRQVFLPRIL